MERDLLRGLMRAVRSATVAFCAPLATEDYVVQSMPDASPVKWHLAHTTWFFETFVLRPAARGYRPVDERYGELFNSYYRGVGTPPARDRRGVMSRPTVAEVLAYRSHVDRELERFFEDASERAFDEHRFVLEVGVHHEEQHQELVVTDLKHALADNPLDPPYGGAREDGAGGASGGGAALGWAPFDGGLVEIGHAAGAGAPFAFDNECPRHQVFLEPFELGDRPVTCGEYAAFIEDRGYERPDLWLSDGWDAMQRAGWTAPLYWRRDGGAWRLRTLAGVRALDPFEPVCHVSYYEAEAYARWAGARLPREEEWEHAAALAEPRGNFLETMRLHPAPLARAGGVAPPGAAQLFGDVWEWTMSPYAPYPGYAPFAGVLGEYNGKFMVNQLVLRGGSCATPARHIRATYRNFFEPRARWQFSGIRLAR